MRSPYIARFATPGVFKQEANSEEKEKIQTKAEGQPNVASNVGADIQGSMATGSPLPLSVRRFMEPRFQADFSNVKIHTNDRAAKFNRQLSAQAFTLGNHIFFGKDKFKPDSQDGRELIAHELTHTIQQGAAVQRKEDVKVTQQSTPQVQRLGISDALDYFADRANIIPGFRMFTIILGVNPINMSRVDRSAANILRAIVEFIPGGNLITRALDNYGIFERVGTWIEQQIRSLGMTGSAIRRALDRFLDSLSWRDIFNLGGVWERARRIFTEPIDRIIRFVRGLANGILGFIKDAILQPLARLASQTRGYDLLKAVLGRDPITGDPYPRNADTLIGGFMKLIGQEEVWNNIKRANAVARAWAWFQGALAGLIGFVRSIPTRFMQVLRSLTIQDLVLLPRAYAKVGRAFLGFVGQFISWAGRQVMNLLQIIFEVVAPGVMPYLRRAAGAFRTIIHNPIGFVRNLVRAGIRGFQQFARNFLTHLRASLIGWLTGTMSGANIYIPQGFNLREILKFVLSVLGITWQNIRQKLVRVIGEPAVRALETGFELVRTLVTEGPAAAWRQILEGISNLRQMVMEQIMTFVRNRVVQAAITRLVTSLNPAGAFVQAIIATYNTIMFFVERLRQIIQVGRAIIDSIVAIARGVITAAANRVEQTMAGMLTLVISFLARIAGLGRVSDAVTRLINRVRAPIDRALDRVVAWIVRQARRLGRFVASAGVPRDPQLRLRAAMQLAIHAVNRFSGRRVGRAVLNPILRGIKIRYQMRLLELIPMGTRWGVRGVINPEQRDQSGALIGEGGDEEPITPELNPQGTPDILKTLTPTGIRGNFVPPTNQLNGQKYEYGYVGNVPAGVDPSKSVISIAELYMNQGFNSSAEAQQRFGMVIGVNLFADLRNRNEAQLAAAVRGSGGWSHFPLGVFGFLWKPDWKKTERKINFEKAQSLYRTGNQETQNQMEQAETTLMNTYRSKRLYPYGAFRDIVFRHSFTSRLTTQMNERANRVFVHTGDPDAVSLRAIQTALPSQAGAQSMRPMFQRGAEGLFNRYDRHLRQLGDKAIIVSGGYQMSMRANLDVTSITLSELATLLASMLDMEIRRRMSNIDPRSVYFPEPNTLFRIRPDPSPGVVYLTATFGRSNREYRTMLERIAIEKNRETMRMVKAEIITAPDREQFVVDVSRFSARLTWDRKLGLLIPDLNFIKAVINQQAQSHANPGRWAEEVGTSYGVVRGTRGFRFLVRIYNHYYKPVQDIFKPPRNTPMRNLFRRRGRPQGKTDSEVRAILFSAFSEAQRQVAVLPLLRPSGSQDVFAAHFREHEGLSEEQANRRAREFLYNINALAKAAVESIIAFIVQHTRSA